VYGHYPRALLAVIAESRDTPDSDGFRKRFQAGLNRASASGAVARGYLFRRAVGAIAPAGGLEPEYLAVFESDQPGRGVMAALVRDLWSDGTNAGQAGSSTGAKLLWSFASERIGPDFRAAVPREVEGILVVFTDRLPAVPEWAFEEWYNNIHIPEILETGLYHTAYRYRAVEGAGKKPEYAAFYETDQDPALAANRILDMRDKWSGHPQYGGVSEVRLRWAFETAAG
jgi:hypothetical protein